jgi:protein O-mannosyl-transferase
MASTYFCHPRLSRLYLWSRSHANGIFLLISALWVVLLYGPCICGAFIYDDVGHIQENSALASWRGALHYFRTSDPFARYLLPGGGSSYRPLLWISLALDRHLWGLHPCGFHLTNLLLHWMSGFLYFVLLRRMQAPTLLTASVCLLWLGLPINSEAVAWISGRTYPLMCVFLASSLLAADSYLTRGFTTALFFYTAGLFAALLSNEEGILVLPLTILLAYFREKVPQRRWLSLGMAGVVTTAIYFVLRRFADAHIPSGPASFLMFGKAFFKYIMWILFPVHMSVERSTDTPANGLSLASVAALIGIFSLLTLLYWFRKRNALTVFGLTWMVIALLPFCGTVSLYQGMAERYVYLASFGVVLAIIAAAWQNSTPKRFIMLSLIILWGLWGAKRLESRASDWKDSIALYQSSLQTTPGSTTLIYNLGTAFEASGNFSKARDYYHKALDLNPKYTSAMVGLGNIDQRTGNMAKAEQEYRQAAAMDPFDGNAYCYLGALLFREGKIGPAIEKLSQAVTINPSNPTAYFDLGVIYQESGDAKRAAQMYAKVLALQPGDPDALANLQTLRSME